MDIQYGRGKFQPPAAYVEYMNMIADSPNYDGMPYVRAENGKINWQCSSGVTTSFYKYFPDRFRWWVQKADALGIPGTENSDDRLTIAARMIHPTKKKVCLICGEEHYVGYMYMNANYAKQWNKLTGKELFHKAMPIYQAVDILISEIGIQNTRRIMVADFPEKANDLELFDGGNYEEFFSVTQHIRSVKLSPGYMGDCPHRLDGIHDYCTFCRKRNDPGRSDENMRTYNHDRRAFMWWAEGDWKVAESLYNCAGTGICANCRKPTRKISPDHVGPLSCGFKQNAFFKPLCGRCNSAKNRRFTYNDVMNLLTYEEQSNDSVASWQVRTLWNCSKEHVTDDHSAKILSNYMRAMQHYFLKMLAFVADLGYYEFLCSYLHPEYSHYSVEFFELETDTLSYSGYTKQDLWTNGTRSFAARSVRIAFEELFEYCSKPADRRKSIIFKTVDSYLEEDYSEICDLFAHRTHTMTDKQLKMIMESEEQSTEQKDAAIMNVIEEGSFMSRCDRYCRFMDEFEDIVSRRGYQLAELCVQSIDDK